MGISKPKFSLTEVKRLAQEYLDGKRTIKFTAPRKSTEAVVAVLLCAANLANRKIATGLLALKEVDFHKRVWQWDDVFDEYGLENYEEYNWYVKFCIVNDEGEYIEEVSFHPLDKEMILPDGRTLSVSHKASNWKGQNP